MATCRPVGSLRIGISAANAADLWGDQAVIDNLVKGAAGQAVQSVNIMFGFDEQTGLDHVAVVS